jgi:hypothetical protein
MVDELFPLQRDRGERLPEERQHLAIMRRKKTSSLFPLPLYALMYM